MNHSMQEVLTGDHGEPRELFLMLSLEKIAFEAWPLQLVNDVSTHKVIHRPLHSTCIVVRGNHGTIHANIYIHVDRQTDRQRNYSLLENSPAWQQGSSSKDCPSPPFGSHKLSANTTIPNHTKFEFNKILNFVYHFVWLILETLTFILVFCYRPWSHFAEQGAFSMHTGSGVERSKNSPGNTHDSSKIDTKCSACETLVL